MLLNFNSKDKDQRLHAFYAAKILIACSRKYLDENKIHFK